MSSEERAEILADVAHGYLGTNKADKWLSGMIAEALRAERLAALEEAARECEIAKENLLCVGLCEQAAILVMLSRNIRALKGEK